mgnify:CR=1 FL=1
MLLESRLHTWLRRIVCLVTFTTISIHFVVIPTCSCKALKNLDCSNNPDLTYLPEELVTLKHLDNIRACECGIETIRDLEGCARVSQLYLNKNCLTELDGPTLGSMRNLKHLEANENAIDEIPAEIANLAKTLQASTSRQHSCV